MVNKKIILLIGLILISSSVFAFTYTIYNPQTQETIMTCETNKPGGYLFFKPEYRPQPINGLKPIVNLSLITGTPLNKMKCDN